MKKIKFYSFASALLLATAAGLGSCAQDSTESTGGENTGTREVVKTQFAINIPYANGSSTSNAKTRMTDTNTQNASQGSYNNFRGIQDLYLLAFSAEPKLNPSDGTEEQKKEHYTAKKVITIGSGDNAYSKGQYTALYRDIEIPVGTSYFIMNGRAAKNKETMFEVGSIKPSDTNGSKDNLNELNFELEAIASEADFSSTTENDNNYAKKIAEALTAVANTEVKYNDNDSEDKIDTSTSENNSTTIKWSTLSESTSPQPVWMSKNEREFLTERYKRFTSLQAGSQASAIYTLENLQQVLIGENENNQQEAGTTTISSTKHLTQAIYDACMTALTKIKECRNFPRNLNLPDGVAQLSWSSEGNKFVYNSGKKATFNISGNTNNEIDYTKICYPAEISYFISTPAMVSDKDISSVNDLPAYSDWLSQNSDVNTNTNIWTNKGFSQASVSTSTKSVALKDPVQYSVACLKTIVTCAQKDSLLDNAAVVTNGYTNKLKDQNIAIPSEGFQMTAVLVGGQPAKVGWDFYPTSTEQFANTIYDKDMNSENKVTAASEKYIGVTSSNTTPNYTLVLDNKSGSSSENSVYVTIEFTNNSTSFYGKDGLIPAGSKFYLVGLLNPSETESNKITKPDGCDRVFIQDHTTVAKFTIKNLKNAYNCIPDLRTAGLNVGLAVDLSWQKGIEFNVTL